MEPSGANTAVAEQAPPERATIATFHCGHCEAVLPSPQNEPRIRCESCGGNNDVPHRVSVRCARCGHEQRIRHRQWRSEVLCAQCNQTLEVGQITLMPLRRRHAVRRTVDTSTGRRVSAAMMLILYGVALVMFLTWIVHKL